MLLLLFNIYVLLPYKNGVSAYINSININIDDMIDVFIYLVLFAVLGLLSVLMLNKEFSDENAGAEVKRNPFRFLYVHPSKTVLLLFLVNIFVCLAEDVSLASVIDLVSSYDMSFVDRLLSEKDWPELISLIFLVKDHGMILLAVACFFVGLDIVIRKSNVITCHVFYLTKGFSAEKALFSIKWLVPLLFMLYFFLASSIYFYRFSTHPYFSCVFIIALVYWSNLIVYGRVYSKEIVLAALLFFATLQFVLWFLLSETYLIVLMFEAIGLFSLSLSKVVSSRDKLNIVYPLFLLSVPLVAVVFIFYHHFWLTLLWMPVVFMVPRFYYKKLTFNRIVL